ncbi:MAG: endonuclease [Pseudomonadota bacterium]
MFNLFLHTALLVLAAFILGAILGCLLRRFFASGSSYGASARSTPAETAAAVATATVAARTQSEPDPKPTPTPAPAAEPEPQTAAEPEPEPEPEPAAEPAQAVAADGMDEEKAAAAIAALPADASNEDKANAVGQRPEGMDAPIGGKKDNLQRIKGIGKVNEGKLNDLGIYHFSQIGEWNASQSRWVGTFLSFAGRIEREDWIGQAKVLADGGETAFAKRVDKGEVSTSKSRKKKS